jgi:transcriptional antiterminator NusG
MNWYALTTPVGKESNIKRHIEKAASAAGKSDKIGSILIPVQKKMSIKKGKQKVKEQKLYPGYLFVEADLEELVLLLRTAPYATQFVNYQPVALSEEDVKNIKQADANKEVIIPEIKYNVGDPVRIHEGPFKDFAGKAVEIDEKKGKVKVEVVIFGRQLAIEFNFDQIEKV